MEKFEKLMEVTDLVMLDIKEMDPEKHKALTGQANEEYSGAWQSWLNEHGKPDVDPPCSGAGAYR